MKQKLMLIVGLMVLLTQPLAIHAQSTTTPQDGSRLRVIGGGWHGQIRACGQRVHRFRNP
jgi:hypothetical protein